MIVDFRENTEDRGKFRIVDLDTDRSFDADEDCFYADDEAGVVRRYRRNRMGGKFNDPATRKRAYEEIAGLRLKITAKEEGP